MALADSSGRIRISDVELAYRIPGSGKPVVLVHGLACGQRMWFHQRRKLSDRHTVITYDQRGHGYSDAPDDASRYSGGHLTRDLAGMVDALNLTRLQSSAFPWEAARRLRSPPRDPSGSRIWSSPTSDRARTTLGESSLKPKRDRTRFRSTCPVDHECTHASGY
jgi:pimeloyl-ACP methyl ester carboxylesterase